MPNPANAGISSGWPCVKEEEEKGEKMEEKKKVKNAVASHATSERRLREEETRKSNFVINPKPYVCVFVCLCGKEEKERSPRKAKAAKCKDNWSPTCIAVAHR